MVGPTDCYSSGMIVGCNRYVALHKEQKLLFSPEVAPLSD